MARRVVRVGMAGLCMALVAVSTPVLAAPQAPASTASAGGAFTVGVSLVAGYFAAPAGGVASASLRFKIPTVKCTGGGPRAVSIGLGDVADLQAPLVRAHAVLTCPAGGPVEYTLAVQVCSDSAGPLTTKHGHSVSVTLAQSGGMITATVTDEKDGTTITATDASANCDPPGTIDSVLFGSFPVFAPSLLDVPNFNKVKSRDTTLNGAGLSGEKFDRQTDPGIKTSSLKSKMAGNVGGTEKQSGKQFSLRYRDVVHCCLGPASVAGALRRAA